MVKLIPLSSKKMKELGIVNTKKGLMFNAPQVKLPVKKKENKNETSKERSKEVSKEKVTKPSIQKVVVVDRSKNNTESKRLADRGIY